MRNEITGNCLGILSQKRLRAPFLLVLILLFSPPCLYAGSGISAGYLFTRSPSPRASGLGEASGSIAGDVSLIKYNPGLLASISQGQLSLMYNKGFIDDAYANITTGFLSKLGTFAGSIDYYDAGVMDFYDSSGRLKNVNGQKDIAIGISYGRKMPAQGPLSLGITLKYLTSTLVEYKQASCFALDLGSLYDFENVPVNIGFSVLNLGTELKYIKTGDPLPTSLRLSGLYQAGNFFVVNDLNYLVNEKRAMPSIGLEYLIKGVVALRSGYKFNSDVEGFSCGFGVKLENFRLNYSFGLNRELYDNHNVSLDVFIPQLKAGRARKEHVEIKNYLYVKVMDETGRPFSNATIKISQDNKEISKIFTNENGEFTFSNLRAGIYKLKAWKQGFLTQSKQIKIIPGGQLRINFLLDKAQ